MSSQGLITLILPLHIAAGVLALVFGYPALLAAKGGTLHRRSGLLFVLAVLTMSLTGALIAFLNGNSISLVAGLLTFYFVATALATVRPRHPETRWIDVTGMLFAIAVALLGFSTGVGMLSSGRLETYPMFMFGIVGLLAATGDFRVMRRGGIQGARQIARHLWRMCFAMWVAAASFFWGPPGRVPEAIDIPALLPIPVLLPIAIMVYWLWRLRSRRAVPSRVANGRTPQPAPPPFQLSA